MRRSRGRSTCASDWSTAQDRGIHTGPGGVALIEPGADLRAIGQLDDLAADLLD
jgi:hypothetical protein